MNIVSILRSYIGPVVAAGAAAYVIYLVLSSLRFESKAAKHLRDFRNDNPDVNKQAVMGDRIVSMMPINIEEWQGHLNWAQRGGYYPGNKLGNIMFTGVLYTAAALMIVIFKPIPIFWALPVVAFIFPLFAMRAKANKVRKKTIRALPEVAALVAAELSAGTPADQAVLRAAELPGPLSGLLIEAVSFARQTGRPLFSRKPVKGALVEVFARTSLPALRAFALQVDEVANKGVDAADLMADAAKSLAREYRERVMAEKELLGGKLTRHVAFHFFMPSVIVILAAFFIPMIALMTGGG